MQVLCGLKCLFLLIMWSSSNAQAPSSTQWQVHGLRLGLSATDEVTLSIDQLKYADSIIFDHISYQCPKEFLVFPVHRCSRSQIAFDYEGVKHVFQADVLYDFEHHEWSLQLLDSTGLITAQLSSDSEIINLGLQGVQFSQLMRMVGMKGIDQIPEVELSGQLTLNLANGTLKNQGPIKFTGLNYEHSEDIIVAGLAGQLGMEANLSLTEIEADIQLTSGEMLYEQLYIDFSGFPLFIQSTATQLDEGHYYQVNTTVVNQPSMHLDANWEINRNLDVIDPYFSMSVTDSHHFNQQILNSLLGIYGVSDNAMSGQFVVTAHSKQDLLDQWQIDFKDYYFLNEGRKIDVQSLDGKVHWYQYSQAPDSALNWESLLFAGLPVGPSSVQLNFSQDEVKLLGEHRFPVFDGIIELKAFEVQKLFSEFVDMQVDANVLPISLRLITEKMGWPIMSGTISGDIPGMIKQGSVIQFLGDLQLQVFDGDMTVNNLSIERLFGVAPVIAGDVIFSGFDLSILTETFGFGLITGKLHGQVDELRITNWKTDRLDAQVYTVKTKGIKQIISQRAIENISSLGGIKGAISSTFLRFFDDFRYKRIMLSCKLHNSVCEIGGLKNKSNQFIIVEGGGIPKINIVGFVRSINWEEFISRLLNANYSN